MQVKLYATSTKINVLYIYANESNMNSENMIKITYSKWKVIGIEMQT